MKIKYSLGLILVSFALCANAFAMDGKKTNNRATRKALPKNCDAFAQKTTIEREFTLTKNMEEEIARAGISTATVKLALERGTENTYEDGTLGYSYNVDDNNQLYLLAKPNLKLFKLALLDNKTDHFLKNHFSVAGYLATQHFKDRMFERLIVGDTIKAAIKNGIQIPLDEEAPDNISFIYPTATNRIVKLIANSKTRSLITVYEAKNFKKISTAPEHFVLFTTLRKKLMLDQADKKMLGQQQFIQRKAIQAQRIQKIYDAAYWKEKRAREDAEWQRKVAAERKALEAEDMHYMNLEAKALRGFKDADKYDVYL